MEGYDLVFVVIDGLDGSGKSTQANALAKHFEQNQKTVCLRVHPSGDNFFGLKARLFLYSTGKSAHFASALFYMIDVIRSILLYSWRKYDYTIFVRYLMGTAYLPKPLHIVAYEFFKIVVPKSPYMFFLDVSPDEAYRRIQLNRDRQEMFENVEKLCKVRSKAVSLICFGDWKIINANKPTQEVTEKIQMYLSK
jgi:dTMP kinase